MTIEEVEKEIIERGDGTSTIVVPEKRDTIVVPERRDTIIVPETRTRETIIVPEARETLTVPETRSTRESLREEQERMESLRTRRDAGERALANEVDATKREMLQREIDRLREDQRVQERRLEELERQLK